jgi:hypothetical protein
MSGDPPCDHEWAEDTHFEWGGGLHSPTRGVVVSADQPLTADELATIKARAEAGLPNAWYYRDLNADPATTLRLVDEIERLQAGREMEQRALANALPLVAEVERLRAQVERVMPFLDGLEETFEDCTPSRGCTGCEILLQTRNLRAALAGE